MMFREILHIKTQCGSCQDITKDIKKIVEKSQLSEGLCNIFLQNTTAALMINEDDKMLIQDFKRLFSQIREDALYNHQDNAFSHLRANLLSHSITVPVANKQVFLGIWQSILLWEFDKADRERSVIVTVQGE